MSLEKICQADVVTVTQDQSIHQVATLMREHSIGDVVVVDADQSPVGLLTDRDIVVGALAGDIDGAAAGIEGVQSLTVSDVMSSNVVCARIDDMPYEVAMKMRDNGVARMPVLDQNGKLCGIVTSGHIFRMINEELTALVGISTRHRETESRAGGAKKMDANIGAKTDLPNLTQPILQ